METPFLPPEEESYSDIKENNNFKEFNYSDYYLKLKYTNQQIEIIIFDINSLDGIKYYLIMNINEIYQINNIFKSFNDIKEIYESIIQLIEKKNYKIIKENKCIILSLIFNNNDEIKFKLNNIGKDTNEFVNALINKINILKNEIKLINEIKEENKKLKKENEEYKKLLNKNKREIISIEEFNKKYGLTILNNDIEELKFNGKNINNEIIECLSKVELKKLKYLYLGDNDISDIKSLENSNFENLELLSLRTNLISDISILEKINLQNLKQLWLYNNIINNIKSLEKANFQKLEILSLHTNMISDISVFGKINLKYLRELYLNNNSITDINPLAKADCPKLELLSFDNNEITDISVLEKVNFLNLKKLYLPKNKIKNINCLEKVYFPQLLLISLHTNMISDISCLERAYFKELRELYLYNNSICNIDCFNKTNFEKLKILALNNNKIDKIKYASTINNIELKVKDFRI